MRTVGLLGGMSAGSTTLYYQAFNRLVRNGWRTSLRPASPWSIVLPAPMVQWQAAGDWDPGGRVPRGRRSVGWRALGAEARIPICANTMHIVADAVQAKVGVPVLHIADATADAVKRCAARGRCSPRASPWKSRSIATGWPPRACGPQRRRRRRPRAAPRHHL